MSSSSVDHSTGSSARKKWQAEAHSNAAIQKPLRKISPGASFCIKVVGGEGQSFDQPRICPVIASFDMTSLTGHPRRDSWGGAPPPPPRRDRSPNPNHE